MGTEHYTTSFVEFDEYVVVAYQVWRVVVGGVVDFGFLLPGSGSGAACCVSAT